MISDMKNLAEFATLYNPLGYLPSLALGLPNRRTHAGINISPFGTLLPTVATSYLSITLYEIMNVWRGSKRMKPSLYMNNTFTNLPYLGIYKPNESLNREKAIGD